MRDGLITRYSRSLVCGMLSLLLVSGWSPGAIGQPPESDPFALGVRETEPQTADDEQKSFSLPPGFTIQLVAAEPQIAKPMNLAFDARGRLWVSSSEEYPFAAPSDRPGKDTIRILEDTNDDGRADVVTTFADGLNIPIGLLPYRDGVICYSIPNILFLRDTDGDGRADVRHILYGPFDTTRDTHGMCNAFRRGADGWVYACHGFNNQSEVSGRDGHKVTLHSGNTFRFRPDGSRIEHFTVGQVNPFGMAIDQFGDLFTADCHTKPVTLLLQGGWYESFGRPHDGLGFVPRVMEHLHGSTAIAGMALGQHLRFPPEYQDSSFGGNVMTSRINRNTLVHIGSSVQARELPDFCASSDPWFRPVDLVPGPDGALYVADFYNRIIGHYEVDLFHPGRDRHRGRIWKIRYSAETSADTRSADSPDTDLSRLDVAELISHLKTAVPPQSVLIADRLADEFGPSAVPALQTAVRDASPVLRQQALRLLARLEALDAVVLQTAAADPDERVRVHAFRTLNELRIGNGLTDDITCRLLLQGLADPSPMVRRVAVLASSRHPFAALIPALMDLLRQTNHADVHLRHAIRMALRDHLKNEDWFRATITDASAADVVLLADLCLSIRSAAAGEFVATHIDTLADAVPERLAEYLPFAAEQASAESAASIAQTVQGKAGTNTALQLQLLDALRRGFEQRSAAPPASVSQWAERLALQLLQMSDADDLEALHGPDSLPWSDLPHPQGPGPENPWSVSMTRRSADGQQNTPLFSSFERGEQRTGIYRSGTFVLADQFRFFVAGHDGFPEQPAQHRNLVRLVHSGTGEVLKQAAAPRNDVAQKVEWDTRAWQGQSAFLELVDGDNGKAYAWLAAGRFSDPRLNPDDGDQRRLQAALLAGGFQLQSLRPALALLATRTDLRRDQRSAMATAIVQQQPDTRLAAAALIPLVAGAPDAAVNTGIQAVVNRQPDVAIASLEAASQAATLPEQLRLAEQLCSDVEGTEALTRLVESGRMSARLLLRPTVQQRLSAVATADQTSRIAQLTLGLPNEDSTTERRITDLRRAFRKLGGNAAAGQELFGKNCTACHQLAGQGKKVGPNLDGLGQRGLDRITEDLLAPNRNVDVAFRTTTVVTHQGKAISGLLRELEAGRFSLVDSQGQETLLSASEIDERIPSKLSPMPVNFVETLSDQQLRDLVAWLMSLRQ